MNCNIVHAGCAPNDRESCAGTCAQPATAEDVVGYLRSQIRHRGWHGPMPTTYTELRDLSAELEREPARRKRRRRRPRQ